MGAAERLRRGLKAKTRRGAIQAAANEDVDWAPAAPIRHVRRSSKEASQRE